MLTRGDEERRVELGGTEGSVGHISTRGSEYWWRDRGKQEGGQE